MPAALPPQGASSYWLRLVVGSLYYIMRVRASATRAAGKQISLRPAAARAVRAPSFPPSPVSHGGVEYLVGQVVYHLLHEALLHGGELLV